MNNVYDLLNELKSFGAKIYAVDDKIKLDIKEGALTNEISERIRYYRDDILALIGESSKKSEFIQIEKVNLQGSYPISDAQRRLWVLSQFEGGSVAYNMPGNVYLNQDIDIDYFKRAIDSTIERHEILRTVFKEDETGEIRQWVLKREDLGFAIDYIDYRKEKNKQEKLQSYKNEDSYKAFDLEKGPLLRACLIRVEEEEHVFYFNMHHIISDGWSMEVLSKDVFSYYEAYKQNKQPDLKELRIQYKDYSAWQLSQLKEESCKDHRAYWLNSLNGELPLLDLPSTKQRPRIKTNNGHGLSTYIEGATTSKLKRYSEANGGSLFMGLLAAWNILMYRYTSQKDIIIGTPIAGREHADLEHQIGFYVNTLALRNEIKPEESFDAFYRTLKDNTLNAYSHQMYPFDRLVEELDLQRDTSRSTAFDISITYHNISEVKEIGTLDNNIINQITSTGSSKVKFDIELHFQEIGDYLSFNLIYNEDIHDREMIEGLMDHYKRLLNSLISHPERKIGYIDYLSRAEKHELLVAFNDTEVAYPKDKTIVDLFEEQVKKTPNNIALVFEEKELTYRELSEKSNQLANLLQKNYNITTEDLVGIQLQRSEWMIISILGILKAGGAYVPIDPEYPSARKQHIIEDTSLKVLITEANFVLDIDYYEGDVFAIDVEFDASDYSSSSLKVTTTSNNLAYVMYTSGSTGRPKGVMIEQKSVIRLVKNTNIYSFSSSDKLLSTGAISFDATTFEYWGPLLNGGQLVLCSQRILLDNKLLNEEIRSRSINIMWFTSGWLNQLVESEIKLFNGLKTALAGGDKLSPSHIEKLRRSYPELEIINGYGPTENTTFSITHNILEVTGDIPIGNPINNTQIYLLSEEEQLQPKGIIGEICIGGAGLARGYLNQEELTKKKFIANPFKEGERLYKTGDLGRWISDGNIEFIGRKDNQVKIRGYRIELSEIEHALQNHLAIEEAVVLAKENQKNEKELVAYITGKEEQNTSNLRSYLKGILPEYMLPAYFVQLDSLPLTSNGKIDRKSLPDPQGLGLSSGVEYVAPRNEIEEKLVGIWQEVLQRENIGIKDDFFDLGGHSLKVIRLANIIHQRFHIKIELADIFKHIVLEDQAALIYSAEKIVYQGIEVSPVKIGYSLSSAQKRLYFLHEFTQGSIGYNVPMVHYLGREVNKTRLESAIRKLILHHESLRTSFIKQGDEMLQQIHKEVSFNLDEHCCSQEDFKEYLSSYIRPFNLAQAPLLRSSLTHIKELGYVWIVDMHHIISDGTSQSVLRDDFLHLYEERELPALRIQYKDFSEWQNMRIQSGELENQKEYWLSQFAGGIPRLNFPADHARPALFNFRGSYYSFDLDKDLTARLRQFTQQQQCTLQMALLSVLNVLLHKYTGQEDFVIGCGIAGRRHADLDRVVGMFMNSLAVRNYPTSDKNFSGFLKEVSSVCIAAYENQDIQFEDLVDMLKVERDASRNPVFDMCMVTQNFTSSEADGSKLLSADPGGPDSLPEGFNPKSTTCKFDLTWFIYEKDTTISIGMEYYSAIYDQSSIERLAGHFKNILKIVLNQPELKISEIDLLNKKEEQYLLDHFVKGPTEPYPDATLHELFEKQSLQTPDHVAVHDEKGRYTYKEVSDRSNRLANFLTSAGVMAGAHVGILQDRSCELVVSMLGILKCGATYVAMDSTYPEERLLHILRDAGIDTLLTEKNLIEQGNRLQWRSQSVKRLVCINAENLHKKKGTCENALISMQNAKTKQQYDLSVINTYPLTLPQIKTRSQDTAYIIYTSGSTGKPKGVKIQHKGVVNTILFQQQCFDAKEKEHALQFASIGFDASVSEIFVTILSGGTIYMIPEEDKKNPVLVEAYIKRHGINLATIPPVYLQLLQTQNLQRLKKLVTAGESPIVDKVRAYLPYGTYYNAYGPTEASICAAVFKLNEGDTFNKQKMPIGRPISNAKIYILDSKKKLLPVGVPGEICIGGAGLSSGYLNNKTLTAEKFIANPYSSGERLYLTGDLGKWHADGNIEFIGRKDDQIKIRGYRVEPGEIENVMLQSGLVKESAVLAKEMEDHKCLVAYFVTENAVTVTELKNYLAEQIPAFMMPAYYVQLEVFPMTVNGKLDRSKLPEPDGSGVDIGKYLAPDNRMEEETVEIWSELLKIEKSKISVKSNFFELGGNSILIVKLSKMLTNTLGREIGVSLLFQYSNIRSLVDHLNNKVVETNDKDDGDKEEVLNLINKLEDE